MTITASFFPDRGYVLTRYAGSITDDDICAAYEGFHDAPGFVPGMNEIVDLRARPVLDLSPKGMQRLAEVTKRLHGERIGEVTSFVVTRDVIDTIMVKLYGVHAEKIDGEKVVIVRDMQDAVAAHERLQAGDGPTSASAPASSSRRA